MTEAEYIKRIREYRGITQGDLARKLGYTNPQFISNWERGLSNMPPEKMSRFARVMDVDPLHLVTIKMNDYKSYLMKKLKNPK